jgi:hypothetical protein
MIAIANFGRVEAPAIVSKRPLAIAFAGTTLALCLAAGAFLSRGGGTTGSGFAARVTFAAASLAFVVAYLSKPMSRLFSSSLTRALGRESAGLMRAFAGMYAVFLACIVAPYSLGTDSIPVPTLAFALLSLFIVAVMLFGTSTKRALGSRAGRAMLGLSSAYFWCTFAANDLDHMVGPHRLDPFELFYQVSLSLLVLALLLRFVDAFLERRRVRMAEAL